MEGDRNRPGREGPGDMKFLLDVCVSSRSLQAFLVAQGHDALSAIAIDPKASDERLMAMAHQDERVFVTEDKDFGELIFVRRLPHGPIVRDRKRGRTGKGVGSRFGR